MKRFHIFDFDGTLIDTPLPEDGAAEYERITGNKYPHKGWWGREESLHPGYKYPVVPEVFDAYTKARADGDVVVLQTNRLPKLRTHIDRILDLHGMTFDHKFYQDGRSKSDRLVHAVTKIMVGFGCDKEFCDMSDDVEIVVWEDMDEQVRDLETLYHRFPSIKIKVNHVQYQNR